MPIKSKPLPSTEYVRELLDYCPDTGEFRWKVRPSNCVKVGDVAGCVKHLGYVSIKIAGVDYKAHRLAWLCYYGEDPGELYINHKDSNPSNNRIANLEMVTQRQNCQHAAELGGKSNGLPCGVSWHERYQKYTSHIQVGYCDYHLGYYADAELAGKAYRVALEAIKTTPLAEDQIPLLLANAVEAATGTRPKFGALRSLPRGVYRDGKRFKASIQCEGAYQYLGLYATPEEASRAYQTAAKAIKVLGILE